MFLSVVLFAACVNNSDFDHPITLTSEQCDSILAKYLVVENDLYELSISSEEAMKQGITVEAYEKFYKLMNDVNKTLSDAKEQGIPIYGMNDEKILFSRASGILLEYPDFLCGGRLSTNTSDCCEFQGSSSIYISASSDDPVWAIGFENAKNGERFVMSGSATGKFNEREYSVAQGAWFTDWSWNVIKLGGSEVSYSFRGYNCLNIEGTLAGCVLKVVDYDPASYTIQVENKESNYKRVEIYWGTLKVGEVEFNVGGQSYTRSNCSYGDRYTVKVLNNWGMEIGDAVFNLDKLWQFI